jgi:hypothetical protein
MRHIVVLIASALVIACEAVSTHTAGTPSAIPAGDATIALPYYLPKTQLKVTVTRHENQQFRFSAETVSVPDISQAYYLQYKPSILSDDKLCITRTADGLLTNIRFRAVDRTADILINVFDFAARLIRTPTGVPVRAADDAGPPVDTLEIIVDPYEETPFSDLDKALVAFAAKRIEIGKDKAKKILSPVAGVLKFNLKVDAAVQSLLKTTTKTAPACPKDRVCYRTLIGLPLVLTHGGQPIAAQTVLIHNRAQTPGISVTRAVFVEKVTYLHFESGVLTGISVKKQSELLAISEFPLRLLERLLDVPANFAARAFGNTTERAQLREELVKINQNRINARPGPDTTEAFAISCDK